MKFQELTWTVRDTGLALIGQSICTEWTRRFAGT
jgi:hypothetical protein